MMSMRIGRRLPILAGLTAIGIFAILATYGNSQEASSVQAKNDSEVAKASQANGGKLGNKSPGGTVTVAQAQSPPGQPSTVQAGPAQPAPAQTPPVQAPPEQPPPVQPPPVQPPPVQPAPVQPAPAASSNPLGTPGGLSLQEAINLLGPQRGEVAASTSANAATGQQAFGLASTDVGNLLGRSPSVQGVETQARNPVTNDVRVRGYHLGEVLTEADGVFWFPARQDLDTFLSKIDSGMINNVIVLKGPYSAIYGPGFSFIDIETFSPLMYDQFEAHERTLFEYKSNGGQLYGRQDVSVGDWDWGAVVSYGQRTGQDYYSGNGTKIPSAYDTRDFDATIGIRPTTNSQLIFGAVHLDQTGLEFPGQIFDTDVLTTDAYRLRFILDNQYYFDHLQADGWYNHTAMFGDAQHMSSRLFIPQLSLLTNFSDVAASPFTGFTDIDQGSTGYRLSTSWGKDPQKEGVLTIGTDLHRLWGGLNEFDSFGSLAMLPCAATQNFPIPPYEQTDLGFFAEYSEPITDCLSVKLGARGDYVNSNITGVPPGYTCSSFLMVANQAYFGASTPIASSFEQDKETWLVYGTLDYKLDDHWTIEGSAGHSERPPTPTELYAIGPYLSILQNGFTAVIGNPGLESEKLTQLDLGLKGRYDRFRFGIDGFFSYINDYITEMPLTTAADATRLGAVAKFPTSFTNALTVQFVNTSLATLAGFDMYGEADLTEWLTPYMTMSYVQGYDDTNNIPLSGIPPLDMRLGIRVHEGVPNPRFSVEFESRIVARQYLVASSSDPATNLNEQQTAGFVVFNLRGYWRVAGDAKRGVLLTAGIDNLFNRNYREHLDLLTGAGSVATPVPGVTLVGSGVLEPGITPYLGLECRW